MTVHLLLSYSLLKIIENSIMMLLTLLALFGTVLARTVVEEPSQAVNGYCYEEDSVREQYLHFATKTAYQLVKGTDYKDMSSIENCEPVKFWLFSRHGTRLPELEDIKILPDLEKLRDAIIENYKKEKTGGEALCQGDLELIGNWTLNKNITEDHEQWLVDQGWEDLKLLAMDYQAVYPKLLLKEYDAKHFLFRHTDLQRTQASYRAFVEGLFGEDAYKKITLDPIPEEDVLLGPHNSCDLFDEQGKETKKPGTPIDNFQNSDILKNVMTRVSSRLGFQSPLTYDQISLMFDMCRFEKSWFLDQPSAWCTAFTFDDVKVLEFFEDMKHEYKAGYFGDINGKIPCALVQDMLNRLESDEEPAVTAYFSHSTLMHLFFVSLGVFKDKELLTVENYATMDNRQWRGSYMVPFASNVAVAKYNCKEGDSGHTTKVQFFLNQKPLEMDGCQKGLCDLKDLISKYDYFYNADCPNEYCRASGDASHLRSSLLMILITISAGMFRLF